MHNYALRWTFLALALISLSACGTVSSNPACICPPIKEYSREFQNKLATEIEKAPTGTAFPEVLMDYSAIRAQFTQCQ